MRKSPRSTSALSNSSVPKTRLIDLKEVSARCGVSRGFIYAHMRDKSFPQNVTLNDGAAKETVRWIEVEIDAWIEHRIARSRSPNAVRLPKRPGPGRGHKSKARRASERRA